MSSAAVRRLLAAICTVVLALAAVLGLQPSGNGPSAPPAPKAKTLVLPSGGQHKTVLKISPGEQRTIANQAKQADAGVPTEHGLVATLNTTPSPGVVKHNDSLRPAVQRGPPPPTTTGASPYQPGCTTAVVGNRSSRGGAPILLFVWHWTGSAVGSGEAIVSWFNQARSQASSTWIQDRVGKCWLTVPVAEKAWTEIAFNSVSVADEVVNPGVIRGPYGLFPDRASFEKAVTLARWAHHALGIPYRQARVTCSPYGKVLQSGFIDHVQLGPCGGGHPDVGSYDYMKIIRAAAAADHAPVKITHRDHVICRDVHAYRARRAHHKPQTRKGTRAFQHRIARERKRGLKCTDGRVHRIHS